MIVRVCVLCVIVCVSGFVFIIYLFARGVGIVSSAIRCGRQKAIFKNSWKS